MRECANGIGSARATHAAVEVFVNRGIARQRATMRGVSDHESAVGDGGHFRQSRISIARRRYLFDERPCPGREVNF